MCKCNPAIKTPYCGRGDCVWPKYKKKENTIVNDVRSVPRLKITLECVRESIQQCVQMHHTEIEQIVDEAARQLLTPDNIRREVDKTLEEVLASKVAREVEVYLTHGVGSSIIRDCVRESFNKIKTKERLDKKQGIAESPEEV